MSERWLIALALLAVCILALVLGIRGLLGIPMPWASRKVRLRYWEDRLADLEAHRDGWRWCARPSEARAEDEAIEEARLMVARHEEAKP